MGRGDWELSVNRGAPSSGSVRTRWWGKLRRMEADSDSSVSKAALVTW